MECGNLCLNLQEKLSMDRKEFSNMLVEARKEAGKSRFDVSLSLGKPEGFCQRIENAQHNYKVRLAQECLTAIGYVMSLYKSKEKQIVMSKEELSEWIKACVKDFGGQSSLASHLGISRLVLNQAVSGKTDISIDSFLSIAIACGYEIKIEKNNTKSQIKTAGDSNILSVLNGLSLLGYCIKASSASDTKSIQDKGDISLFLNQCVKSHGGKEKIAVDLNTTVQHISDMILGENTTVIDFQNIATKCGYEIKIERV